MNFVIWGTGIWGKRMYRCLMQLNKYNINAFIDSSENIQGSLLYNLPVISYEDYKKRYKENTIIVSIASKRARETIKALLIKDKIYNYFFHINCPSEMIFLRKGGLPLAEIVKESGLDNKRIAIMGNNLWSLVLYDYLAENNYFVLILYYENKELYKFLTSRGYKCLDLKERLNGIDLILNTDGSTENKNIKIEQKPFKDFSFLRRYKNKQISELCNKFKEVSRCFIVATGPSLKIEDLSTLAKNKEFCFSMNRTYLAFEKTTWRPDVYVVADGKCLEDNSEDLINLDVPIKLYSDASILVSLKILPGGHTMEDLLYMIVCSSLFIWGLKK